MLSNSTKLMLGNTVEKRLTELRSSEAPVNRVENEV